MSTGNKASLMALYKAPYSRTTGDSSNEPYFDLNVAHDTFLRRAFCAPGERFAVPETNMVVRWVRVRGTGVVAGTPLKAYTARTGTAIAGSTAGTLATGATLPVADVGNATLILTGGTGIHQARRILDSDGATTASVLTIVESDNSNYLATADLPEAWATTPDGTTTYQIYANWEVTPQTAATDLVSCVAIATVTDGNWTMVIEEGLAPLNVTGATAGRGLTAGGLIVPSATTGTAEGATAAGVTAADAAYHFARSLNAYTGTAAVKYVDLLGRFKQ